MFLEVLWWVSFYLILRVTVTQKYCHSVHWSLRQFNRCWCICWQILTRWFALQQKLIRNHNALGWCWLLSKIMPQNLWGYPGYYLRNGNILINMGNNEGERSPNLRKHIELLLFRNCNLNCSHLMEAIFLFIRNFNLKPYFFLSNAFLNCDFRNIERVLLFLFKINLAY